MQSHAFFSTGPSEDTNPAHLNRSRIWGPFNTPNQCSENSIYDASKENYVDLPAIFFAELNLGKLASKTPNAFSLILANCFM